MTQEAEPSLKLSINLTLLTPISFKGDGGYFSKELRPFNLLLIDGLFADKLVKSRDNAGRRKSY